MVPAASDGDVATNETVLRVYLGGICVCVCFNDLGRKVMVIGDLKDVLF